MYIVYVIIAPVETRPGPRPWMRGIDRNGWASMQESLATHFNRAMLPGA